jgi:hypothetical protein
MKNKKLFGVLAIICFAAALIMKLVGNKSSHLSELKDFWWMPIPLGVLLLLLSMAKPAK